jgi:ankyrin repeat protein
MMMDSDNKTLSDDHDTHTRLFFESIEKGDCSKVELYLGDGIDLTVRNNIGWTALMVAVTFGKTEIVRLLLKKGAEVNAQSFSGLTALKMASYSKNDEIIQLLKQAGAKD